MSTTAAMIMAGPLSLAAVGIKGVDCYERLLDGARERALRFAKRAEQNLTPAHLLTKDEKIGLAVAAGVPVDFVDGKLQTSQPIGISRIGGCYHVYTEAV